MLYVNKLFTKRNLEKKYYIYLNFEFFKLDLNDFSQFMWSHMLKKAVAVDVAAVEVVVVHWMRWYLTLASVKRNLCSNKCCCCCCCSCCCCCCCCCCWCCSLNEMKLNVSLCEKECLEHSTFFTNHIFKATREPPSNSFQLGMMKTLEKSRNVSTKWKKCFD